MFSSQTLLERVMYLVPMLLSLTVHEFAHAFSAYRLGDDTAARLGRMTLNPFAHIDPIGTLLLPLLGIPFGWAKPVPFNPVGFTRRITMRTGALIVAAAGPLANLLLAVLTTVCYGLLARFAPAALHAQPAIVALLHIVIEMNVLLALFNLLPVPPLDGSKVVDGLVTLRWRPTWESLTRLAPFFLAAVIFFGSAVLEGPRRLTMGLLQRLLDLLVA